jgi:primosomal protein N' (replication factor Y)
VTVSGLLRVAVPVPLARLFDYQWPEETPAPAPGCRVHIPFGRREQVGVVVAHPAATEVPTHKLKSARRIDREPVLDSQLLALLLWLADYYHHAPGEVLAAALPALLRRGQPGGAARIPGFTLTPAGRGRDLAELGRRAPRQAQVLTALHSHPDGLPRTALGVTAQILKRLEQQGWIEPRPMPPAAEEPASLPSASTIVLNQAQAAAVTQISAALDGFAGFLLHGVTGSGKTEVYMRLMAAVAARGLQTLYLVPEIGLTPQLVGRLRQRFGSGLALAHSGLTDRQRLEAWQRARTGAVSIIVGTRSAVFAPLPRPGLVIVDEEHDGSYKQQDGFRYSARDVAVLRAQRLNVPVVLGTATPSLESMQNVARGRYQRLRLPERVGAAGHPTVRIIDLSRHGVRDGLSTPLLQSLGEHLAAGNQALLFLNRRGFAPTLFCPTCAAAVQCRRCDARLTVHRKSGLLKCHHCGHQRALPTACETCGEALIAVGEGTQRVEETLACLFPEATLRRIDRDSTRGQGKLARLLQDVEQGEVNILVGTQMLTKGHDFPRVTLVAVLNADQGLFGTEFRASERLAQTIVQVAGRGGRADRPGEVLIQTQYPDHPLLATLLADGYDAFAQLALAEREAAGWPPFTALAVLRAEAVDPGATDKFLRAARSAALALGLPRVTLLGPAAPPMERRAGRHRGQLLLLADTRPPLHELLAAWLPRLEELPESRRARWALDVDPTEV